MQLQRLCSHCLPLSILIAMSGAFRFRNVKLFKSETLGSGAYGVVCKAKCDQLICAAKILHNALFKFIDPSANTVLAKFEQECFLNSAVQHPNIVQYIHTYQDPESSFPVLIMELCDESLTSFLERSNNPLPYHLELDLSRDIALALCYLHTNDVIHRDLTSNNVLLINGRAKITDFGMSKLIGDPRLTTLSICPGNMLYMSPEALQQPPRYSTKLDCFSWGILAIQIMTRLFPEPGPQFLTVEKPDGRIIHEVIPEHRRRQSHIELVDPKHPLLALAIKCLSYSEKNRPDAVELCDCMAVLCQSEHYLSSKNTSGNQSHKSSQSDDLKQGLSDIVKLRQQLQAKDEKLHVMQEEIAQLKQDIEAFESQEKAMKGTLRDRDETITDLQRNLEQQQHIISTLSSKSIRHADSNHSLQTIVHDQSPPVPPPRSRESLKQPHVAVTKPLIRQPSDRVLSKIEEDARAIAKKKVMTLSIIKGDKAPEKMSRGAVTVHGSVAYFVCFSSPKVHAYQRIMGKDKWITLPKCPYIGFTLAVIGGFITIIGGCKSNCSEPTNTLLSLTSDGNKKKWLESLPPMPTARQEAASVSTESFVVVIGGRGLGGERLNVVEVLKLDCKQWAVAGGLPTPLTRPSATVSGDEIFIGAGSPCHGTVSKHVYTTKFSKLLSPYYAFPNQYSKDKSNAWQKITSVPADHYTLCTLNNKLLAIGGIEMSHYSSDAIRKYNPDSNTWEVIGHISNGRSLCLAAAFQGDMLVVVGGLGVAREGHTNTVDIASVMYK